MQTRIFRSAALAVAALAIAGCALPSTTSTSSPISTLARAVMDYCAHPPAVRDLLQSSIDGQLAPNRVAVVCGADREGFDQLLPYCAPELAAPLPVRRRHFVNITCVDPPEKPLRACNESSVGGGVYVCDPGYNPAFDDPPR